MKLPKTLSQYPWVTVRIDCVLCERKGCYRLARLAARYGPEQTLDGLLADLARTCPWWRTNPRKYEARCGARFVDLERNLPPSDDPDKPVFRQRQPGREDVPQHRSVGSPGLSATPMLSGLASTMVVVTCPRCGRRDCYIKTDVLMNGGDVPLTELLCRLTADCPRRTETGIYELCQARYDIP